MLSSEEENCYVLRFVLFSVTLENSSHNFLYSASH